MDSRAGGGIDEVFDDVNGVEAGGLAEAEGAAVGGGLAASDEEVMTSEVSTDMLSLTVAPSSNGSFFTSASNRDCS